MGVEMGARADGTAEAEVPRDIDIAREGRPIRTRQAKIPGRLNNKQCGSVRLRHTNKHSESSENEGRLTALPQS
jgi:hypothetical protein